jgi:hypothetical protein
LFRGEVNERSRKKDKFSSTEEEDHAASLKPKSNDKIGLQTNVNRPLLGWRSDETDADNVGLKTETNLLDPALLLEPALVIMKGDEHKADRAAVPVHLWEQAFLCGYGQEGREHRLRHQLACNLNPAGAQAKTGFMEKSQPPEGWKAALVGFRTLNKGSWIAG